MLTALRLKDEVKTNGHQREAGMKTKLAVGVTEPARVGLSPDYLLRLLSGTPQANGVAGSGQLQPGFGASQPATTYFNPDAWLRLLSGQAKAETDLKGKAEVVEPTMSRWQPELWLRLLSGSSQIK